jgi:hypothetical protein
MTGTWKEEGNRGQNSTTSSPGWSACWRMPKSFTPRACRWCSPANTRFSPLSQINTENVGQIKLAFAFELGSLRARAASTSVKQERAA